MGCGKQTASLLKFLSYSVPRLSILPDSYANLISALQLKLSMGIVFFFLRRLVLWYTLRPTAIRLIGAVSRPTGAGGNALVI